MTVHPEHRTTCLTVSNSPHLNPRPIPPFGSRRKQGSRTQTFRSPTADPKISPKSISPHAPPAFLPAEYRASLPPRPRRLPPSLPTERRAAGPQEARTAPWEARTTPRSSEPARGGVRRPAAAGWRGRRCGAAAEARAGPRRRGTAGRRAGGAEPWEDEAAGDAGPQDGAAQQRLTFG